MVDLTPFKAGIDAAMKNQMHSSCVDPRSGFMSALLEDGFDAPNNLIIGRIDRIKSPCDRAGKKSGWYIYNEIEDSRGSESGSVIGIATYGDWKSDSGGKWCSRYEASMSEVEKIAYREAREEMNRKYEEDKKIRHDSAAEYAFKLWADSKDATSDHPYLKNKQVDVAEGVKITNDGKLIIPVAHGNKIRSVQFIDKNGAKRFLKNGETKGCWFVIEGNNDEVYIAEGYATGASVHKATKNTVYVSFSSDSLYDVASFVKERHGDSRIIIAADDDFDNDVNAGRIKAEQAAQGLNIDVIFPDGYNDFNDMHVDKGIETVSLFFNPNKRDSYVRKQKHKTEEDERPLGILGNIVDYYRATSGNKQEGFAIQTALAVASVVLGRSYKTSLNNWSNLYLLNVAKSGTGKEHAKTVVEEILQEAGCFDLILGDGYTSSGAVFSALLNKPCHISCIDEFGRYLESGVSKGSEHQRQANTKLMEAIGRSNGVIRPPTYSTMTMKKSSADSANNRLIHNPSITLLTMTTPDTLFNTIDMESVKDGFIGRFIISISEEERSIRKHKRSIYVPDIITSWITEVRERSVDISLSTQPADAIKLEINDEAMQLQEDFQRYCIDKQNELDKCGMGELPVRSNEMAMKISLICALSKNPNAEFVDAVDMSWSIAYVKNRLNETIERLKVTVSHSDFEHSKKEILDDMRRRSPSGVTWSKMQKTPPYSRHKPRDLKEILASLKDADLITDEKLKTAGRPKIIWIAIKG